MIEFIQWCFRNESSGSATILVMLVIIYGIKEIIYAIKGKN